MDSPFRSAQPPFEQLFDAAPAFISIHEGPDHVFIYSNPANDRALGKRDLIGLPLREALPEFKEQGVFEQFEATYRNGMPVETPEFEAHINLAGNEVSRGFYRQVLQPWHNAAGAVTGVMSFTYNVTEQVEARLRAQESERYLSYALETGEAVGIFDWDTKLDSVVVDARFLNAFGIDPSREGERLPLTEFFGAIHEEDRERIAASVQCAVETGEDYEESFRVVGERGEDRYVLARGRCLRDSKDKPDHFTGVVVDMTKQQRGEQALRESEARFRSVFSSIDKGYAVAEMIFDKAGEPVNYRFLEVNAQFEEMSGLKDAQGRTVLDLVPDIERKWIDIYVRVALAGETLRFEDDSEAMGRHFEVFAMPVEPYGRFVMIFKDITATKQMQDTLRRSEAEFRTITEAMPQIVWAARPDGYHEFYNARWYEFTGVTEGTTDGEGWSEIFHPDDQEQAWASWRHSLATGDPYEVEYRLRHHSGQYRWVLGRAQPVRDQTGRIVRWLGTCTDIHEIKIAEEQRQLMLGEMNHRMKNTLAMVHAIVSQTLRQADNLKDASAAIQSRIGMMAKAHDRLINSDWTQTRVCDVIEAALAPHRTGSGRFTLEGPNLPIGSKQALALTMALHELATNAVKYGALYTPDGRVDVSWHVTRSANEETFNLVWNESDGPPVEAPKRRGFGSRMIEQALAGYFSGKAELDYQRDGLRFDLQAPLAGLTA